jgi:hypothetical protein
MSSMNRESMSDFRREQVTRLPETSTDISQCGRYDTFVLLSAMRWDVGATLASSHHVFTFYRCIGGGRF